MRNQKANFEIPAYSISPFEIKQIFTTNCFNTLAREGKDIRVINIF
jgi:hypothetical protein